MPLVSANEQFSVIAGGFSAYHDARLAGEPQLFRLPDGATNPVRLGNGIAFQKPSPKKKKKKKEYDFEHHPPKAYSWMKKIDG
jgi:hypothetical protein